jgi:hypothetical protein
MTEASLLSSKNSAKQTLHVPRITVRTPRHSGQSATGNEGLTIPKTTQRPCPTVDPPAAAT